MRYLLALLFVGLAYYVTTVYGHIAGAWTAAASVQAEAPRQKKKEIQASAEFELGAKQM